MLTQSSLRAASLLHTDASRGLFGAAAWCSRPHGPQSRQPPLPRPPSYPSPHSLPISETQSIESRGIAILTAYLQSTGRNVASSPRKTFDLLVDGIPAEVKCKQLPWAKLDFIGFTDAQHAALVSNESFRLFVVCNLKDPDHPEIVEITSDFLRRANFKVESTHYIYGPELRSLPATLLTPHSTSSP